MAKQGTEITSQRAQEFGLEPQQDGEDDWAFRARISGALREQGHMIEAHEAHNNSLYDDPDDGGAMTGIIGAVAQAMQGTHYGARTGYDQIGNDIASGEIAKQPRRDPADDALLLLAALLGR